MYSNQISRRTLARTALGGVLFRSWAQPGPSPARLSEAEKIQFLLNAKVTRTRTASRGITGTLRATLTDGRITHDASIQSIDERKTTFQTSMGTEFNFRDSWKFDVAGYKLDRLLGLNMVPVSVSRKHQGRAGCFTWWVDDVLMLELDRTRKKITPPDVKSWNEQMEIVRVFDQLIYNMDRNLGNLVIDKGWRIWMIDHSRSFRWHKELKEPKNLTRCDRALLAKLKSLNEAELRETMGDYLEKEEIVGLLARRDKIVGIFEQKGEPALYESPRRAL